MAEIVHIDNIPIKGRAPRRRGRLPQAASRVGPTPETALKHIPDPIASLDPELQRYALRIARTHAAIVGAQNVRAQIYEQRGRSHGSPLDKTKDKHLQAYREWKAELMQRMIPVGMVLCPIIDMVPCWHADMLYNRQPGRTAEWLIEALEIYGKIAR